jgi:hypothetical protein
VIALLYALLGRDLGTTTTAGGSDLGPQRSALAASCKTGAGSGGAATIVGVAADGSDAKVKAMAGGRYWPPEVTLHVPPGRRA